MLGSWRIWAVIIVGGLIVSAWGMFQVQRQEIKNLQAALDNERELRAAAENQLALNEAAMDAADATRRVTDHTRDAVSDAQREIANAQTAHDIYLALVAGVDRVWADPEAEPEPA